MEKLRVDKISQWVNGRLIGNENAVADKVSTDTRTLTKGSLFVAIRGEKFDGHDFIGEAFRKGAGIVLSEKEYPVSGDNAVILVKDTVKALGDLARNYIKLFDLTVIGITGSVGKTTTKEMIAQVLSTQYKVHKTMGNFNNQIGLPLSVLNLDRSHSVAVFEMGMSAMGEIDYLSRIIQPDIGIITNIGISHIEKLGSRQNILRAKLEIINGMKENGVLILNGDDELLSGLEGLLPMPVVFYGINDNCNVKGYGIESLGEKGVRFTVNIRNRDVDIFLPVPGIHNVSDALAAIACAIEMGITDENIQKGLIQYSSEKMRMNIVEYGNVKVINDTYNAAPASSMAALSVLREISGSRRSIAVLGDMLELGAYSEEAHKSVGACVAHENINYLVAIGELAKDYVVGAVEAGMDKKRILHFPDPESAVDSLRELIEPNDVVLFKASRGMHLDRIIEDIFEDANKK
ncbi:UDP-N-acetylmuramoyl-tripeptide--D-alanyl-D-alanine ligase [Thermoclostridium stercorarium subsp. leptospartum DSM 9219]|uniref:UDP-N-acetylmuramoyl-tripeptide--D-alanyl-D-alanine ligase n=2 Tax=Thermoclostridium stercorarium TaxID=1510 RepID=A0A1B1YMT0_THEST|nr:UDP-N-acetylmuramoyl-tripeptide--D-alanyl-D-alanine ligase [Thermoclostridium stercorarium]ANX02053.1 UDP-N-acetylmuramoyl-tripeptide--D-alanyl-D-alanine ligase [Thermoclostridium stercorarium subsp. leptospartum DSM 9219]